MSEHHVLVEKVAKVTEHDNSDNLEIAWIKDNPVVVKKGELKAGDLATYIPVDAVVPEGGEFSSIYKYTSKGRIRAAKLRGKLSLGLLWRVPEGAVEGDDVAEYFGITKYEPPIERQARFLPADAIADPGYLPRYDIEGLRRWPGVLIPGEEVVITEKLHGANARFLFYKDQFWVGSRNLMVKPEGESVWAQVARQYDFEAILSWQVPAGLGFYGELLGVQDLAYGLKPGTYSLRIFDIYDVVKGRWLNWDAVKLICEVWAGLEAVPVLYCGPWNPDLVSLAEGQSTIAGHVREGIVVKPTAERSFGALGRVILKLAGEGYLLRKEAA